MPSLGVRSPCPRAKKEEKTYALRLEHGLRTPNECINQRNLKIWPMWQTKYALAVPENLGVGVNFRPCSEGYFLSGRP